MTIVPIQEAEVQESSLAKGSAWALARLTDHEFSQVMEMAVKGRARVQQVMRSMMKEGTHFGAIPGAGERKVLLKPGGEVLRQMFRLVAVPQSTVTYGDGASSPQITVQTRAEIRMDSADGPLVAVAERAATSWEVKYRYREAQRKCPQCGKEAVIRGSAKYGGGWLCWKKKDGCGAKWPTGAPEIEKQEAGRVENTDPHDQLNTLVAMSEKRAVMAATINATGTSDLYYPDHPEVLEEDERGGEAVPHDAGGLMEKEPTPGGTETVAPGDSRGFMKALRKAIAEGKQPAYLGEDSERGQESRRKLLEQLLQADIPDVSKIPARDWGYAVQRLATLTGTTTEAP